MTGGHVVNEYDVLSAVGALDVAWFSATRTFGWKQRKAGTGHGEAPEQIIKLWDDVVAQQPLVAQWATIGRRGNNSWFPATYIPAISELRWTSDHMGKIGTAPRCVIGRPCECIVQYDSWTSGLCSRPAVEPPEFSSQIGGPRRACPLHVAAQRRVDANDAARRAEYQARDEAREHANELSHASRDWAQRLADELGIRAEGHRHAAGEEHLRVLVEPERLYRQLVDLMGELRDLGLEDLYPFKAGEVAGR